MGLKKQIFKQIWPWINLKNKLEFCDIDIEYNL
jgi:hypothetical protein